METYLNMIGVKQTLEASESEQGKCRRGGGWVMMKTATRRVLQLLIDIALVLMSLQNVPIALSHV